MPDPSPPAAEKRSCLGVGASVPPIGAKPATTCSQGQLPVDRPNKVFFNVYVSTERNCVHGIGSADTARAPV